MKRRNVAIYTMTLAIILGGGITYAKQIPGVDKPYNEGAYYDPTVVDEADSPSVFALRDIAANGGTVYDYTREVKSIIFGNYFKDLVNITGIKLDNSLINATKLSADSLENMQNRLDTMNNTTANIINNVNLDNQHFRQINTDEFEAYAGKIYDYKEQSLFLSEHYKAMAEKAGENLDSQMEDMDAIATAINLSNNAIGEMQAGQSRNNLEAINAAVYNRRNVLMANMANIMALRQLQELDEKYREGEISDQTRMGVVNPYNENVYTSAIKNNNYERPKPTGMPNF